MKTEIEVKFCDIDTAKIRAELAAAGGVCEVPMRLMRRVLIEEPHHEADHSFLRVRDEGDKVTLTFKRRGRPDDPTIDSVQELEVTVSDFEDTVAILREAGWSHKTYQETKRETWKLGEVEVVIDEWPWLPPYIEIEGDNEAAVRAAAETLGFDWADAQFGHIDAVYARLYDFAEGFRGVIDLAEVRFTLPRPKQFIARN